MHLWHYSKDGNLQLPDFVNYINHRRNKAIPDEMKYIKPPGLWLSDDDELPNWRSWCVSENFRLESLRYYYDVELYSNPYVLYIYDQTSFQHFQHNFKVPINPKSTLYGINWPSIMNAWNGIIISPYRHEQRLDSNSFWYCGWDCASAVIWNPKAIKSISLARETPKYWSESMANFKGASDNAFDPEND